MYFLSSTQNGFFWKKSASSVFNYMKTEKKFNRMLSSFFELYGSVNVVIRFTRE